MKISTRSILSNLKAAGRDLLTENLPYKFNMQKQNPVGKGAGGDKTYMIDKLAEDIIIGSLKRSGKPFTVISEECGIADINGGGMKVLIDPIDGSKNAVAGIPFYCAAIAVLSGDMVGDVEVAYTVNLINGEEFWAEKGKGAFLGGKRLHTQTDDEMHFTAYETQVPGRDMPDILPLLLRSRKTRCFGSIALDLACLARGAISLVISPSPSRGFDFGAGYLLVKEAGGVFTDIRGNSIENITAGLEKNTTLLASANKNLHEKALGFLKS